MKAALVSRPCFMSIFSSQRILTQWNSQRSEKKNRISTYKTSIVQFDSDARLRYGKIWDGKRCVYVCMCVCIWLLRLLMSLTQKRTGEKSGSENGVERRDNSNNNENITLPVDWLHVEQFVFVYIYIRIVWCGNVGWIGRYNVAHGFWIIILNPVEIVTISLAMTRSMGSFIFITKS